MHQSESTDNESSERSHSIVEKLARDNEEARAIVREVTSFGVNENQKVMIVYLLALELEDVKLMKAITSLVRDHSDAFLSSLDDVDEQ